MKKLLVLLLLAVVGYSLITAMMGVKFGENRLGDPQDEKTVSAYYLNNTTQKLSVSNVITAIVVNYRGLDTLGEVSVLFLASLGLGSILYRKHKEGEEEVAILKPSSQLLQAGSKLIFPAILMLGAYVFIHGHLTPGGGFQGGAIIATGFLLMMMAYQDYRVSHSVLVWVESLAGITFAGIGMWGLLLGNTFLENFLPIGTLNNLFSGGIIPIIYIAVGFKVAAELTGVLDTLLNIKDKH
ncbi:MAG: Na(+)/H(+) antiporter subunit B [Bacteroidales bacterium]|nr:Na(+)/H(+) antiporter subunit B [Bacteroidales bacterium]